MKTWRFHLPKWYRMGLVWAISASFIYTGLLIRSFPHLKTLNLTYRWFNCMTNLTQICLTPWNSFNGKMDDILLLELFQGIIRNIERLKERTLLLGEGYKLEGNLISKGGPQNAIHIMTPIEAQLALGTQSRY